jgi:hypothetical protein
MGGGREIMEEEEEKKTLKICLIFYVFTCEILKVTSEGNLYKYVQLKFLHTPLSISFSSLENQMSRLVGTW